MATPRYTRERTALLLVDPYKDFLSKEESSGRSVRDVAQSVGCTTTSAPSSCRAQGRDPRLHRAPPSR